MTSAVNSTDPKPTDAMVHLDLLRGVSAVAVLVQHARGICFVSGAEHMSLAMKLAYFVTGFGHAAVIFFFVLSGFFIGTSVLDTMARGSWSWSRFLLRRLARLWVVLIPVLLITTVIDASGMHLFGSADNIYSGKLASLFSSADARESLSIPVFFGNLFFLQKMVTTIYGFNGALWSLGYEFWCYLLFPLLALVVMRSSSTRTRALALLGVVAILTLGKFSLAMYFLCWLFGAAVAGLWRAAARRWLVRWPALVAGAGIFVAAIAANRLGGGTMWLDFALAAATAVFTTVLLARSSQGLTGPVTDRYRRFATGLAGFSYTLYVVHFPIVVFFNAGWIGVDRWEPTAPRVLAVTALGLGILAFAYVLARVTERHTDRVRRWVEQSLGRWVRSPLRPPVRGSP